MSPIISEPVPVPPLSINLAKMLSSGFKISLVSLYNSISLWNVA
jgi:hypothetical protein